MATIEPRGQQGRQYDQEELESRLRDALGQLMVGGTTFRDLSVARIIGVAGVARSTFYTYYDDKVAMLLVLGAHSLRRLYAGPARWIHIGAAASQADITAGMRQLLDDFLRDEAILRAVNETAAYDARVRSAYLGGVLDYAGALARMIRAGQDTGAMRRVSPAETAEALAWMVERTVSLVSPDTSPARLDAIAEALADAMYRTLYTA